MSRATEIRPEIILRSGFPLKPCVRCRLRMAKRASPEPSSSDPYQVLVWASGETLPCPATPPCLCLTVPGRRR